MATTGYCELLGDALPDDVRTVRYTSREAMSTPFEAQVEISTGDLEFSADDCLRKSFALRLVDQEGDRERLLHGICERIELLAFTGTRLHFRVHLRPSLAALAHREDCRIYQDKSPVDVVTEVLEAAGVTAHEWRLSQSYPAREYIVQYRESELDFVHRLLEQEGIFYFFEHGTDEHKLVLGDHASAFDGSPPVRLSLQPGDPDSYPLNGFSRTKRLRTTAVMLRDYDFKNPVTPPEGNQEAGGGYALAHYEHPGGFTEGAEGSRLATARIRELRHDADVANGQSNTSLVRVGANIEVLGATPASLDATYTVTELALEGSQTGDGSAGMNATCNSSFSAVPKDAPYAPKRKTRKPRIRGLQTATVTGPTSDEQAIHCDEYGRVKVRFHWDRVGQYDDKSSCWLRVAQPPLGGSIIIPRFGWEVSVGFMHGDPDHPYVVGRLYDGQHAPPYGLPGTQTSGSLKSMSTPGAAGSNELIMADSGGSQGFGIHAEKDLNVTIGHDKSENIGVDETHTVDVNMSTSVGANESVSVGGDQSVDVGSICSANVSGGQSILVGGNCTDNTTANYVENVGASRSYTVAGNMTTISNTVKQSVKGTFSKKVGSVMLTASVASIADNVGAVYSETIGAVKLDLCKAVSNESVGAAKSFTASAAEVHLVKGTLSHSCDAAVTQLIGGLHYEKIGGDYSVSAPMITLVGAVGDFKAGGSNLKLGGGPIVAKGSKITIESAMVVKMGSSLKMGPG